MPRVTGSTHAPFCPTPATVWDQSTYCEADLGGTIFEYPSASPEIVTPVVGDYTRYPLGFTFEQYIELIFRARLLRASLTYDAVCRLPAGSKATGRYVDGLWTEYTVELAAIEIDETIVITHAGRGGRRAQSGNRVPPWDTSFNPDPTERDIGCGLRHVHNLRTGTVHGEPAVDPEQISNLVESDGDAGPGDGWIFGESKIELGRFNGSSLFDLFPDDTRFAEGKYWPSLYVSELDGWAAGFDYIGSIRWYTRHCPLNLDDLDDGEEHPVCQVPHSGGISGRLWRGWRPSIKITSPSHIQVPSHGTNDFTINLVLNTGTVTGKISEYLSTPEPGSGTKPVGTHVNNETGEGGMAPASEIEISAPTMDVGCEDYFTYGGRFDPVTGEPGV